MSGTVRVGYAAIHRALADRGVKSHGRFILRATPPSGSARR
nr:hypothetical protein [Angustibacter aerolatus]